MTERLREEFDADRVESVKIPTRLRTDLNTHVVSCSSCGDAYYVDEDTFTSINRAIGYEPDNIFTCPRCEEEGEVEGRA